MLVTCDRNGVYEMLDGDNANARPNPNGGWSTRIVTVKKALVVPVHRGRKIHQAGVLDAGRTFVLEAVHWRGGPLLIPPELPRTYQFLSGRWVWGGLLVSHFGHFFTESIARLWALDQLQDAIDGVVFIAKRDIAQEPLHGFHKEFFELLGKKFEIRIVNRPTEVALLEVPGQGCGVGRMASGTTLFRDFMKRNFARSVEASGPLRLYISRSKLLPKVGGILSEIALEEHLSRFGYEVFHPQDHSLHDQVARYKAAERIVAVDGSALHLVAMVGKEDQKVAMIKRRQSYGNVSISNQLKAFMSSPPMVIDVIKQNWIRSDREKADNHSFGELDFPALGALLALAGFVDSSATWKEISVESTLAELALIEEKLKAENLTFSRLSG